MRPLSINAVLMYARPGQGERADLYADFTFGVWDMRRLVPIAKTRVGLRDEELREVDVFVRAHAVDRFGPVRAVEPRLVFELSCEAIRPSSRHKSGLVLLRPRMRRWQREKPPAEADSLETLMALAGMRRDDLHPRITRQATLFATDDGFDDEPAPSADEAAKTRQI